jgi:hypothetical protein
MHREDTLEMHCRQHHMEVMRLVKVLEKGAEVNAQGGYFGNALQAASYGGHEAIVKVLLEKGAEVNAQGGEFGNALQAASFGGHEAIVKVLLEKGAEVNAQGGDFGNALQAASFGGYEEIVKVLLEKGAEVNAQGGHFWERTAGSIICGFRGDREGAAREWSRGECILGGGGGKAQCLKKIYRPRAIFNILGPP